MSLLPFAKKKDAAPAAHNPALEAFLQDYSIEVMPRTAEKVTDFRSLLPQKTRVYIAHIEGTPIEDMVATAKRLNGEGFDVMPHFPARIIKDQAALADWIARYQGEANVAQALLLAGGVASPHGDFHSSMQLLETGLFDKAGFKRLHIAGHPEGNKDIDPDGSDANVMDALRWKQKFNETTDADMALATQFAFEAGPIIAWADAIKDTRLPTQTSTSPTSTFSRSAGSRPMQNGRLPTAARQPFLLIQRKSPHDPHDCRIQNKNSHHRV